MINVKKFISIVVTVCTLVIVTNFVLAAGVGMIMTGACLIANWCCVIGLGVILWEAS